MIEIDCAELTDDEQIALTGQVTDALEGAGMAVLKGKMIAVDSLGGPPDPERVAAAVSRFVQRRRDSTHYSVERRGEKFTVHSPDPLAASRGRRVKMLPPNLFRCPFCGFVTPHEELYVVHYRAHGFVV